MAAEARWWPVVLPLCAAVWASVHVALLRDAFPTAEADLDKQQAVGARICNSLLTTAFSGTMSYSLGRLTFPFATKWPVPAVAVASSALFFTGSALVNAHPANDFGPVAATTGTVGWLLVMGTNFVLPFFYLRRFPRAPLGRPLQESEGRPAKMRIAFSLIVTAATTNVIIGEWSRGAQESSIAFMLLVVGALTYAIMSDRVESTGGNPHYMAMLIGTSIALPNSVGQFTGSILSAGELSSGSTAIIVVLIFDLLMAYLHLAMLAMGRRALPADEITLAVFPLAVFEGIFEAFLFSTQRVESPVFWLLLLLQLAKAVSRDGGYVDDLLRTVQNKFRTTPRALTPLGLANLGRAALQNVIAEVCAISAFLAVILAETIAQHPIGALTGLNSSRRRDLAGGFAVVLVAELLAASLVAYLLYKRARRMQGYVVGIQGGGGDEEGQEAGEQGTGVLRGALDFLRGRLLLLFSVVLYITSLSMTYVRAIRLDYDV